MNIRHALLVAASLAAALSGAAAAPHSAPRLVVNIVVSSMRSEDLSRYAANFNDHGFRRLSEGGTAYSESHYNYLHTSTPVSLATLTTGATPSVHGIISTRWIDYVTNDVVTLLDDRTCIGLDCDAGSGAYSPRQLVAPTLAEALQQVSPESRVATVALVPSSAVVMGGYTRNVYWADLPHGRWTTSSFYAPALPAWLRKVNEEHQLLDFVQYGWEMKYPRTQYVNSRSTLLAADAPEQMRGRRRSSREVPSDLDGRITCDYDRILYTPAGNRATLDFAKTVMVQLNLGSDDRTDMLNICLDTPRMVTEVYGPESVEVEDMYYQLDAALTDFFDFLFAQVSPEDTVVVLTSDHGTSPSYDGGVFERDRFNPQQFVVIMNSFLSAQHGPGEWVLGYEANNLYLNHTLIYNKGMDLAELQNQTATFAMQFRGVSHALSSTAMRSSYFGSGYGEKMQNSFYPRRSGDVVVNLMPGWIEELPGVRSTSGSMYGYDTNVPLVFYGGGIPAQRVGRPVDMTSAAPTLAHLMGIPEPAASEGSVLEELRRH